MFKIDDKYYIGLDPLNFILKERKIRENGKRIGGEYFTVIGYFSTLQAALEGYIELCLVDDLAGKECDIRNLIGAVRESHNRAVASVRACCGGSTALPEEIIRLMRKAGCKTQESEE